MEAEASSAPICLIGGTQLLLYIWLLFLKQRWVTLALFGQTSEGPTLSLLPLSLPPPLGNQCSQPSAGPLFIQSRETEGSEWDAVGTPGASCCAVRLVTFFTWLAAALPLDMEVGSRLLVLRLLFKLLMSSRFFAFSASIHTNKPTNQ